MTAVQKVEAETPAPVSDMAGGIHAVIERAARDPNVDIDKLERLLAMQERIMIRDAEAAYNAAMRRAKMQMPQVVKDGWNDSTKSRFTKLETLDKAVSAVIAANGFSLSYGTDQSPLPDHYRITCKCSHDGGFSERHHIDIPIDDTGMKGTKNKTSTHGAVSAISYGRRVLKLLIFDIATADDDGNAAGGLHPISVDQYDQLKKKISDVQADEEKFCEYLGVSDLKNLQSAHFQRAIKALAAKESRQ